MIFLIFKGQNNERMAILYSMKRNKIMRHRTNVEPTYCGRWNLANTSVTQIPQNSIYVNIWLAPEQVVVIPQKQRATLGWQSWAERKWGASSVVTVKAVSHLVDTYVCFSQDTGPLPSLKNLLRKCRLSWLFRCCGPEWTHVPICITWLYHYVKCVYQYYTCCCLFRWYFFKWLFSWCKAIIIKVISISWKLETWRPPSWHLETWRPQTVTYP